MQDKVEVIGELTMVTLAGVVQVRPAGVEDETAKSTVPVKPFTGVTVIVEVPDAPERICDGETAPAETVKSTTWKRMSEVVWVNNPLVPVTVIV